MAPFSIEYCEAPIDRRHADQLPLVRTQSPIPIMADESMFDHQDAFRLARLGACDFFNIKLGKSGGIRNALRIVAVGEAAGISSQVGCFSETRIGITALAHLALSRRNIHHYDMDSFLMLAEDPVEGGIDYQPGGQIRVPDSIGLGVTLGSTFLAGLERVVIE
jgi:L-alanine-DL-glutamate epimerase-like enolase superfamily enzyme